MEGQKIAYFAGFFDGEGYVGFGFGGRVEVRVVNTYRPVLLEFQRHYGGAVYKRKRKPNRKQAYDWVMVGKDDVLCFLNDIGPHLREKKERVQFYVQNPNVRELMKNPANVAGADGGPPPSV